MQEVELRRAVPRAHEVEPMCVHLDRELVRAPREVARGVHPERPARALVELLLALAKLLYGLATFVMWRLGWVRVVSGKAVRLWRFSARFSGTGAR